MARKLDFDSCEINDDSNSSRESREDAIVGVELIYNNSSSSCGDSACSLPVPALDD